MEEDISAVVRAGVTANAPFEFCVNSPRDGVGQLCVFLGSCYLRENYLLGYFGGVLCVV